MSTAEVHARLDDFARRLHALERELAELRTATRPAPKPRPEPVPRPALGLRGEPPRPLRGPRIQLPQIDAGALFGARGLAWSGGVVTILGVVFFFVLAVDRGWVGPVARVSLGAAASALVYAGGLWLHRRFGASCAASSAVAAGIAGGFATLLFAAARYDLLPDLAALAVAAALAAIASATALAWRDQTIAGLGLVGAMLVPTTAAIDEPHHLAVVGTAFAVLMFAAAAVVAVRRRWTPLLAVSAAAVVPQVLVLARQADDGSVGALTVAATAWLVLLAAAIAEQRTNRTGLDRIPAGLVTAGTAMAALSAAQLLDGRREGLALLAIAVVELSAAAVLLRLLPELAALLGVAGLTVGAAAASDLLSGATLATAWAAEGAVLAWLSPRLRDARLTLASLAFPAAASVHALVVDAPPRSLLTSVPDPAVGALAVVAVAAAATVAAACARPWPGNPEPVYPGVLGFLEEWARLAASAWRPRRIAALWYAGALALYAASLGLLEVLSFGWGQVAVRALLAFTAVALVALHGAGWRRHLGWAGHAAAAVAIVLIPDPYTLTGEEQGWAALVVAAGALAVVLLDELRDGSEPVLPTLFAPVSLVFAVSGVILLVHDHTTQNLGLLGVAALYCALAALVSRRTCTAMWAPALLIAFYATTALLDGTLLMVAVAAGAAAAVTVGEVAGERRLQIASGALLSAGLVHVLAVDAPLRDFFTPNARPEAGVPAIAALVAATAVFALTRFAPDEPWRRIAAGAAALLGLYGLSLALLGAFEWIGHASVTTSFQRGHTTVSAVWGLLGLLLLVAGLARGLPWLRTAGFALLGVSLAKLFVYDLSALSSITRALSFLAVGAVLLLGGFLYERLARDDEGGPLPAH